MPTRHQLTQKLLREQPHLVPNTAAFRDALVIRSIYVVGIDIGMLANYTGFSRKFVQGVSERKGKEALAAYKAHVNGRDYEPTIAESIKNVGRTIARTLEKKSLKRRISDYTRRILAGRRMARA